MPSHWGPALLASFLFAVSPRGASAQALTEQIAQGDTLLRSLHPDQALAHFHAALQADSNNYLALWKTARATIDIAKQITSDAGLERKRRDSLYLLAKGYAERAIEVDANGAEGHYALALALGRLSRTMGGREKLKYAKTIREEDLKALALDPDHDGAHHILGAWNAEVKRLSGATKFFAKALFGAGFLNAASWDSATAHLERAVTLNPRYIYHHLELAEVYVDLDRTADAMRQLEAIPPLSDSDVLDQQHRQRAADLLNKLQAKTR